MDRTQTVNGDARRWCAMAIVSLVGAGLLSLLVVIGRLPFLSHLFDDPLFFKRCLVVHVDLSLVVWFYAFIAGLMAMRFRRTAGQVGKTLFAISLAGVVAMLAGALMRGAEPVLANYVPVIDHPLFLLGLGLFFAGVVGYFLVSLWRGPDSSGGGLSRTVGIGLQASGLMVALAVATWVCALSGLPSGVDTHTYYEFSIWGAGHALQVANVCAMLAVWLWLLEKATGKPVISSRLAWTLFGVLIAPHFALPLLTARGAMDTLYHSGATQLMRWGIFPVTVVVLVICGRHLARWRASIVTFRDRALVAGFVGSAGLTTLGFALGACIRSSTTLVPAHYHASLGGITASFMAAAFLVASLIKGRGGLGDKVWRNAKRQLTLFGVGQTVFAIGFAIGGMYGLGRKAYASEQHVRGVGEYIGLSTMGVGGLVAAAGGLWFLLMLLKEMRGWWRSPSRGATTEICTQ